MGKGTRREEAIWGEDEIYNFSRVGQLLVTTLPSNQTINENIYLYVDDERNSAHHNQKDKVLFRRFRGDEGKQQRAIVLRNITH